MLYLYSFARRPVVVNVSGSRVPVTRFVYQSAPVVLSVTPTRRVTLPKFPDPIIVPARTSRVKYYVYDSRVFFIGPYPVIVEGGHRCVYLEPSQAYLWTRNRWEIGTVVWSAVPHSRRKVVWMMSGRRVPADLPPVVDNPLEDQTATEGTPFTYTFDADTFSDPDDVNANFTYKARLPNNALLPGWLIFNPLTRTFSGTPPVGSHGTLTITVTAYDPYLQEITDTFNLVISAA